MKKSEAERRLHPRLEQTLPVKLKTGGYDFITSTQNVSCVGAYCRINKYIPPFTKINVKLTLPILKGTKPLSCDVECRGVIVRTEDEETGGFNIAILFNQIGAAQKQKISQYINRFLPQKSVCLN